MKCLYLHLKFLNIFTIMCVVLSTSVNTDILSTPGLCKDDIITIQPNESTDFKCITDVVTVVIKRPSSNNDKYIN